MFRLFLILLIGLGAGYYYAQPKRMKQAVEPVLPAVGEQAERAAAAAKEIGTELAAKARKAVEQKAATVAEQARQESETLSVRLDEDTLAYMEAHFDEIRAEAATQLTELGWRVRSFADQGGLEKLGLKDGDLIRLDKLEELKRHPAYAELAKRAEALLKRLEQ